MGEILGWWCLLRANTACHHGFGEPDEFGELCSLGVFDHLPSVGYRSVMDGGPPVHLLHLPVNAVGVGDGMRIAAGSAAWWAAAPLSGVLLRASSPALGLGGARGVTMPKALEFSAAEGERVIDSGWMSDVVEVDGFRNVGGV